MSAAPEHLKAGAPVQINRIEVDRLFGYYSFEVERPGVTEIGPRGQVIPPDRGRRLGGTPQSFFMIYGENGTGKTALLRLLFNLLSPARKAGHRNYIAKKRFASIRVHLSNGDVVEASRSEGRIVGPYRLRALRREGGDIEFRFVPEEQKSDAWLPPSLDPRDGVEPSVILRHMERVDADRRAVEEYVDYLEALGLEFLLIPAGRVLEGSVFGFSLRRDRQAWRSAQELRRIDWSDADGPLLQESLEGAVRLLRERLGKELLDARQAVDEDVGRLVARTLSELIQEGAPSRRSPLDLFDRVEMVENRYRELAEFGIVKELDFDAIRGLLVDANFSPGESFERLLGAYLEVVEANLEALSPIRSAIAAFLGALNGALRFKSARYSIQAGLSVESHDGQELELAHLSSGEKHLVLLLTACMVMRGRRATILIDEPEISLNVTWLRTLVDSIQTCMGESDVDFLIATHSIEMLSDVGDIAPLAPRLTGKIAGDIGDAMA